MTPLDVLTRDDLLRAGACARGIHTWCDRHAPHRTAVTVDFAIAASARDTAAIEWILCVSHRDGYGDGDGNNYGYGDGDGNNYGDGYGYGNSYGDGDGNNYGDGYGYDSGYGNGYDSGYDNGDGYGDGDGNNYGNGNGDGDGNSYFVLTQLF